MNQTLKGVIIGAILLGILSGIGGIYIALTSDTVGSFGIENKDLWWLAMMLGALCGVFIGGIMGGVIFGFNFDVVKGLLLSAIIILFPALFIFIFSADKFEKDIQKFGIIFAVLVFLTGIIIPLIKGLTHK